MKSTSIFPSRQLAQRIALLCGAALLLTGGLFAQDLATVTGSITDPSGAVVPGANVSIIKTDSGLKRSTVTNADGLYVLPSIPPGKYEMHVDKVGFQSLVRDNITLNVATTARINVELQVGDTRQSVTVTGGNDMVQSTPSVGTVVDREFVGNLPLNGRSFQALIMLAPGVVPTKATGNSPGQFSVNGQRANANYIMVDGVGANFGITADGTVGQTGAGSIPGFSVSGSTSNLVSVDALQEFKIVTSTFAPEYGRTPGGQVSIVTRSGTNAFHGTVFNYFRNDLLDATDWFTNANRLSKPALRQNNFGGVLGGPAIHNRTFFFFSYEGLRLRQPLTTISQVPSLASRQAAIPAIRPFMNALPLPNGADTTLGMAFFTASYSNPTELNATAIRADHTVNNRLSVFARYNHAPSHTVTRGLNGGVLSQISPTFINTKTATVGGTFTISPAIVNEFRANWSYIRGQEINDLDSFGGAVPIPDENYYPVGFRGQRNFTVSFSSATYQKGGFANNVQKQQNFVDSLTWVHGTHQMKFGVDFRRAIINFRPLHFNGQAVFQGAAGAINGLVASGSILASAGPKDISTDNMSIYAQDAWRVTRRLTLTYGIRWELNAYPDEKLGRYPTAVTGLDNPASVSIAPANTKLWDTTFGNFAPRAGFSYMLSGKSGAQTVIRGGIGLFYNLQYGGVLSAFSNSWPNAIRKILPANTPFPYSVENGTPPSLTPVLPATNVYVTDPNLQLPRSYQWNVAIERSLGLSQTISISYIAAEGRRLLRQEQLVNPNATFMNIFISKNAATSDYHSMQVQFTRRLARRLQALSSYTWAHSIDTSSNDSTTFAPGVALPANVDRGASDFDVRHNFNTALTYTPAAPTKSPIPNAMLRNWSVDSIVNLRTGTPVNLFTSTDLLGLGVPSISRPDLAPGVPLYIDDPTVGGGQRFNRAAFVIPAANIKRQGALGRNVMRGFNVSQIDFALRREFHLTEGIRLQFRGEWFNIFNHPNFGDPNGSLGTNGVPNALFGIAPSMLGPSLGGGGVSGGLNPLYQIGGPRSVQLSVKVLF